MEWKSIPAFPQYQASAGGQLRRGDKIKVLSVGDKGYHVAFVGGRPRRVSRLVANALPLGVTSRNSRHPSNSACTAPPVSSSSGSPLKET